MEIIDQKTRLNHFFSTSQEALTPSQRTPPFQYESNHNGHYQLFQINKIIAIPNIQLRIYT
jgi:hypothetical protein